MSNLLLGFEKYGSPDVVNGIEVLIGLVKQLEEAAETGNFDGIEDILQNGYDTAHEFIPDLPAELQDTFTDGADQTKALLQQFKSGDGSVEAIQNYFAGIIASLRSVTLPEVDSESSDGDVLSNDNDEVSDDNGEVSDDNGEVSIDNSEVSNDNVELSSFNSEFNANAISC